MIANLKQAISLRQERMLMNKGLKRPLGIAIVTVIICGLCALQAIGYSYKKYEYDIVIYGDSNVGNTRDESGVANMLSESTGMTVLNAAIGGTTLSEIADDKVDLDGFAPYSLVNLSKAAASGDYGVALADMPRYYLEFTKHYMNYVEDTLKVLSKTDISKAKYIIITQGINDYANYVPRTASESDAIPAAGKAEDNDKDTYAGEAADRDKDPDAVKAAKYDINTFEGALRTSIENFKKAAPKAEIIVVSPVYCDVFGNGYKTDRGFGTQADYAKSEQKIADELGVTYINAMDESGIGEDNSDECLGDGMHMTAVGRKMYAKLLTDYIGRQK